MLQAPYHRGYFRAGAAACLRSCGVNPCRRLGAITACQSCWFDPPLTVWSWLLTPRHRTHNSPFRSKRQARCCPAALGTAWREQPSEGLERGHRINAVTQPTAQSSGLKKRANVCNQSCCKLTGSLLSPKKNKEMKSWLLLLFVGTGNALARCKATLLTRPPRRSRPRSPCDRPLLTSSREWELCP